MSTASKINYESQGSKKSWNFKITSHKPVTIIFHEVHIAHESRQCTHTMQQDKSHSVNNYIYTLYNSYWEARRCVEACP